jgi:hypothetical protein
VTYTWTSHRWNSSGAISQGYGTDQLNATGWWRDSLKRTTTDAVSDTAAVFKNTLFCNPTATTTVNHKKTRFQGNLSGTYSWAWDSTKGGDCSDLLSGNYYLDAP